MTTEAKLLIGIGVVTLALVVGGAFLFGRPTEPEGPIDPSRLIKADSPQRGADNPKVTIVEFADFQCPACAAAHPIVGKVLADYPDSVRFVFRHFPLPGHKHAQLAARMAEAAGEQNKFWEMYDLLFSRQNEWSSLSDAEPRFMEYARSLQLDEARVRESLDRSEIQDKISRDQSEGRSLNVTSTPTFFINGHRAVGVLSEAEFKQLIDAEVQP
jgi:protein-disulfide isomerase